MVNDFKMERAREKHLRSRQININISEYMHLSHNNTMCVCVYFVLFFGWFSPCSSFFRLSSWPAFQSLFYAQFEQIKFLLIWAKQLHCYYFCDKLNISFPNNIFQKKITSFLNIAHFTWFNQFAEFKIFTNVGIL